MKARTTICAGCPFNVRRKAGKVTQDVLDTVQGRIANGEQWVCHETCDGPRVTAKSEQCFGFTSGLPLPTEGDYIT